MTTTAVLPPSNWKKLSQEAALSPPPDGIYDSLSGDDEEPPIPLLPVNSAGLPIS